ncbi:DUF1329 domain-containing protein [Zavarzinia sp.]|uniref:DUF1329 domain-containing protein n=1 Tax=Zavarzinia sp. TaxID=2027920 RepID=UPI003568E26B
MKKVLLLSALLALTAVTAQAASPEEAALLRSTLTPMGGERAGNADGSIPAWTGGMTVAPPGWTPGTTRPDFFAGEQKLFSITAATYPQYKDQLFDGFGALFERNPDFRIDVYKTKRTAAAPQSVYDWAFRNATDARCVDKGCGFGFTNAIGGPPFPIPKDGGQMIQNVLTRYEGHIMRYIRPSFIVDTDGKPAFVATANVTNVYPYYDPKGTLAGYDGYYLKSFVEYSAPASRNGEGVVAWVPSNLMDDPQVWSYQVGQRRVRKAPNVCCDNPNPSTQGLMNYDELQVFNSGKGMERYEWTILGKKEMFVPYNNNNVPLLTSDKVMGAHFANPDAIRFEKHRVWVLDGKLREGERHSVPHRRMYVDEDNWHPLGGDYWDGNGALWKMIIQLSMAAPDIPAVLPTTQFGYDLQAGAYTAIWLDTVDYSGGKQSAVPLPTIDMSIFTPDALAARRGQ